MTTTDPKALPGADPHTGNREIDPVTGYDTTGHEWAGIKELNTPFPRIALIALIATFAYSVVAWVLLPAWPLGRDYTRGVLGLEQGEMAMSRLQSLTDVRAGWLNQFNTPDFPALAADEPLMAAAMTAANRLFQDNCAVCHGVEGQGGPGFPMLGDANWLWGGDPETIAETVRVGINSEHPDTRWAEMMPFDWMERDEITALAEYVTALPSGAADHAGPGGVLFEENCSVCHGEGGEGGLMTGAPALNDGTAIYGQDYATVTETLLHGRRGVMPQWSERLSAAEINLLALYTAQLSDTREASEE